MLASITRSHKLRRYERILLYHRRVFYDCFWWKECLLDMGRRRECRRKNNSRWRSSHRCLDSGHLSIFCCKGKRKNGRRMQRLRNKGHYMKSLPLAINNEYRNHAKDEKFKHLTLSIFPRGHHQDPHVKQ
jgi:hypothetical protein